MSRISRRLPPPWSRDVNLAMGFRLRALIFCAVICWATGGPASAHDVSRSDSKIEIQGREVRVTFTLNPLELVDQSCRFPTSFSVIIS